MSPLVRYVEEAALVYIFGDVRMSPLARYVEEAALVYICQAEIISCMVFPLEDTMFACDPIWQLSCHVVCTRFFARQKILITG